MKMSLLPSWKKFLAFCLVGGFALTQPLSADWAVQGIIGSPATTSSNLVMATSRGTGNAIAGFFQIDTLGNHSYQVFGYPQSQPHPFWGSDVGLGAGSDTTLNGAVAITPTGTSGDNKAMALVGNNDNVSTSYRLYYIKGNVVSGGWSAPFESVAAEVICYELAMNDAGNAAGIVTIGGNVLLLTYDGTNWTSHDPGSYPANQCHILMEDPTNTTPNNHALALWKKTDGTAVYSSYFDGASWSSPIEVVSDTIDNIGLTMTAFSSPPNKFTAYWSVLAGTTAGVHGIYYDVISNLWGSPFDPSLHTNNDLHLQTANDPSPASLLLWYPTSDFNYQIGTPGGSFAGSSLYWHQPYGSSAVAVYGTYPTDITKAQVAATTGSSNIQVTNYTSTTGSWTDWFIINLLPTGATASDLVTSLDSSDRGLLLWIQQDTNGASVQWAKTVPGAPVTPPQNPYGLQITNRYLKQSDLINEIGWSPSTTLVDGYRLYKIGALIELIDTFPSGQTSYLYRDHNQRPGVTTSYRITAYKGIDTSSVYVTIPSTGIVP